MNIVFGLYSVILGVCNHQPARRFRLFLFKYRIGPRAVFRESVLGFAHAPFVTGSYSETSGHGNKENFSRKGIAFLYFQYAHWRNLNSVVVVRVVYLYVPENPVRYGLRVGGEFFRLVGEIILKEFSVRGYFLKLYSRVEYEGLQCGIPGRIVFVGLKMRHEHICRNVSQILVVYQKQ